MEDLHIQAVAIIIGSPELLVVGAFKIASREMSRGDRKGWLLMAACLILLFLTFLTVGDLFMWHWDAAAMNVLMGFRCLAGIAYSFTRGIVTGESEPSVGEQVNLLQEVNRVNQETRDLVHQAMNQVNRRSGELLQEVRQVTQQVNQRQSEELSTALEELCHQSELILDGALERLEHANSQRLHAVYTRLERVTVTLEQSQILPAVPAS